jgi:hypothetical protein
MAKSKINKRRSERLLANIPVQLLQIGGKVNQQESSVSRDVSDNGLYCYLREPLPCGTIVHVLFAGRFVSMVRYLSQSSTPGRVVRVEQNDGIGRIGTAIEFLSVVPFFAL